MALEQDASRLFAEEFAGRILSFDDSAAICYAKIMESRRSLGRPLEGFDGLIAAIAVASGARIAARNITDFEDCDVALVNPWEAR